MLLVALAIFAFDAADRRRLFNVLAGRVTDRIGPRTPALFGYLFTAAALTCAAASKRG